MAPDLLSVLAGVQRELGSILDAIDQHGPKYARAYAEHVRSGGPMPQPPLQLRGAPAKLIRDLVLDESLATRRPVSA